ncbi:hypothetical protein EDB89DRAFT_1911276 [Lactarius sanguifluus]|nr:hypothetical protein EDB89DRAFT_1911276 [Lactarius sanguifluus]
MWRGKVCLVDLNADLFGFSSFFFETDGTNITQVVTEPRHRSGCLALVSSCPPPPSLVICKSTTTTPPRGSPARPTPCRRDTQDLTTNQLAARSHKPRHHATQTQGIIAHNRQRGMQIPTSDEDGSNDEDDGNNDDGDDTGDTRPTTTMVTNARLMMSWESTQYIKITHVRSASRASLFKLQASQVPALPYVGPTSTLCQSSTITPPRRKTCTGATPSRHARPTTTPTCV